MVALKAELLSKQYQVQKTKAEGFNTVKSRPIKKKVAVKQNSGVELRAKRDEEQKIEEEPSLHKVIGNILLDHFKYTYIIFALL